MEPHLLSSFSYVSPAFAASPSYSHSRVRAIPPFSLRCSPACLEVLQYKGKCATKVEGRLRMSESLVRAESQATNNGETAAVMFDQFKRVLLPIIDRNPYLSEATRQAAATTTALAKKCGADITVVVIDEDTKESIAEHDLRINNIRWHLAEGGFENFGLMERLGEGKRPAAVIGEVADDLAHDLVVLSMETIHSKHIDGNLLAEFVPCPVLLLPL